MKAEINKDGLLRIKAETELESFAFGEWLKISIKGFDNDQMNIIGIDSKMISLDASLTEI